MSFLPATFADSLPKSSTAYTPSSLGSDPIAYLPPRARERLRLIEQRAADAHSLVPPFSEINEANVAKLDAQARVKRLADHPSLGGFGLSADHQSVVAAQVDLDRLSDDLARLEERRATREASWTAVSQLAGQIGSWLRDGKPGGVVLRDYETETPKLHKGESIVQAIERTRRRSRELRADLHRIRSSPFPSSYAKAQMREQLDALAQRGAPDTTALIEHAGEIAWPTLRSKAEVYNGAQRSLAFAESVDVVALLAWLHRDAIIKRLDREIDDEADDKAALTIEQRSKAEAEVMGDLLAVERDEAALMLRAWAEGLSIEPRPDIDPRAALAVELIAVVNGAVPGTSLDMGHDILDPSQG